MDLMILLVFFAMVMLHLESQPIWPLHHPKPRVFARQSVFYSVSLRTLRCLPSNASIAVEVERNLLGKRKKIDLADVLFPVPYR